MRKLFFATLLLFFGITTYAQYPCANNNVLYATGNAPTILGDSVFAPDIYGGEYIILNNMVAGNIYKISTCNNSNFDTQISIYNSSGTAVAYNDDWCGMYSEIIFSPTATGNYRILVDEFNCNSNQIPARLVITLLYTPRPVIEIPVVVHVLYNTTQQNISNAQIQSQINVLNQDFRRLNANQQTAPAAFRGRAMDPLIQFCLAQRDPDGNPTNGITRTYTNKQEFTFLDTTIYFTNLGGKNNWDKNSYLNIWVCNIADPYAGWALFPSITVNLPIIDGVVMDLESFGTVGTANPNYNSGHICSHEVGHWLNLRHIWGDDQNNPNVCLGSDSVFDTPNHAVENFGSPSYPHITSCSIDNLGEMFMNFMDYTDDDDNLNMFTVGQFIRMDDVLFNQRASLWNSLGCVPCNTNSQFTASTTTPCVGQTVTFTNQSSSGSYSWLVNGVSYGTSTNFSGTFTSAGQYQVALIVLNSGCRDTSFLNVNVSNTPTASISPTTVTICNGQSVTLTASGGGTYSWSNSLGSGSQVTVSPTQTTTYTVTVTSSGCSATASRTVNVNPRPNAPTFAPTSGCSPLTVTASSANCTGCTYQWSTGATGATATFSNNANFTVTVTNSNNCTTSANGSVTITGQPAVTITPANPAFCAGGSVTLTVSPSGSSYSWSGPNGFTSNAQSPSVNMPGTYNVTVTNPGSCSGTATASKLVTQQSSPTANAGNDVTIQQGNSTTLTATGGTSYTWNNGATSASTTVSPTQTTTYTVTVTDANGCTATDNVTVFVQSGGCNNIYTLDAQSVNISAQGGTVSVNLTTDAGCSWNVNAGGCIGWVSPNNPNGTGSANISFNVQPNTLTSQRTCFASIQGNLFNIIQEAAPTTGLTEISDIKNISLFPNPNNGKFTLIIESALHQKLNANLYNAIGQLILSKEVETNSPIEFDVSGNAKGIYFLQIYSEKANHYLKVLVE